MRVLLVAVALLVAARVAAASEVGCPARVVVPSATATFYSTSAEGQCSLPIVPGAYYAAVSSLDYAGSELCGRCALVTGPLGQVTVRFTDVCPDPIACPSGHLDLSAEAFAQIGAPVEGIIPISWETVACDVGDMEMQFEGSNAYYLKVQVQDHRYGVASVEMQDGDAWIPMARTIDDHFLRTAGGPFAAPFAFRITSVHGQAVDTTAPIPLANDTPLDTGVQFEACPEPASALGGVAALAAVALVRRQSARRTASSSSP